MLFSFSVSLYECVPVRQYTHVLQNRRGGGVYPS